METKIKLKFLKYEAESHTWSTFPLEVIEIRTCYEEVLTRQYSLANFGDVTVSLIWINSKISFLNKSINDLEKSLIEDQLTLNVLDKSMKYMERPVEDLCKDRGDPDVNNDFPQYGTNSSNAAIVEKNEMEITEQIDSAISQFVGN